MTELLVVLAIMALLASIAVPTSVRIMAIGRRTLCANNLSQIMRMIISGQQLPQTTGGLPTSLAPFMRQEYWPTRVAAEYNGNPQEALRLFNCPAGLGQHAMGLPPLEYLSGMSWEFMPFDPASFHTCSREGIDEFGKRYTEFCIEENPWVESKWTHEPCCGQPSWSTNDGIWRVYEDLDEGLRTVILTYYDCWWPNEIYHNSNFYAKNLAEKVGMTLKFRDVYTNYGYNTLLGWQEDVSQDTIVVMDFNKLYIEPDGLDIMDDLHNIDTARHLGKVNALMADAAVRIVDPSDLYPDVDDHYWTPAAD